MKDIREDYVSHGIAIVNPYGGIWTGEIFDTPEEAMAFLKKHWPADKDFSEFKLAAAIQTTTIRVTPGSPIYVDKP